MNGKLDKDSEKAAAEAMTEMAKSLQKNEKEFNRWKCLECADEPEFEHADMLKHFQDVHQINIKTAEGTREMRTHLDGKDWYQTIYEVVIEGKRFLNSVRNKRNKRTQIY